MSVYNQKSIGSPVGSVDDPGLKLCHGQEIFSSPKCPNQIWGPPSPRIQQVLCVPSAGIDLPGQEVEHLHPTSVPRLGMGIGSMCLWQYTTVRYTSAFLHGDTLHEYCKFKTL